MNASAAIILSVYLTFSVLVAFYAFRVFRRKRESISFCLVAAFALLFIWPYPAVKILKLKLIPKKLV